MSPSIDEKRVQVASLVKCDILTETQAEDNEKLIKLMSRCFVCTSRYACQSPNRVLILLQRTPSLVRLEPMAC